MIWIIGERVLGHSLRGMEATYVGSGVEFLAEQRDALERWSTELERVLASQHQEGAVS